MSDSQSPRVLVVDDEPVLRELLVDALADMDVQVRAAGSGQEAMDMARMQKPDLIVTDLCLADCTGLDVIDRLRDQVGDVPAVVITAHGDARMLTEASRRRPVELMSKPLDLDRLRATIGRELSRLDQVRRTKLRSRQLRRLARDTNLERKDIRRQLQATALGLGEDYRQIKDEMALQQCVLAYQNDLLGARNDDDVFRILFRLFVKRSGGINGIAMVCDPEANLQIIGRFGVPAPDGPTFAERLIRPVVGQVLVNPKVTLLDAGDQAEDFDPAIRKYLAGISILAIPLMPCEGEMIGLAILYRKGEQPFTDDDLTLAQAIGLCTGVTIRRND